MNWWKSLHKYNKHDFSSLGLKNTCSLLLNERMFQWQVEWSDGRAINIITIIHSIRDDEVNFSIYNMDNKTVRHGNDLIHIDTFIEEWLGLCIGGEVHTIDDMLKAKISLLEVKCI